MVQKSISVKASKVTALSGSPTIANAIEISDIFQRAFEHRMIRNKGGHHDADELPKEQPRSGFNLTSQGYFNSDPDLDRS
jgi:hypothetical protein